MKRLFKQIGRMFKSLRRMFSSLTNKATTGTGIAVKTFGGAIGTGLAVIVLVVLLIIIGIAAIPYGAFAATRNIPTTEEVQANANGIVDDDNIITNIEPHCSDCGVVPENGEINLVEVKGKFYCPTCIPTQEAPNEEIMEES
jgi:hypothetical protein